MQKDRIIPRTETAGISTFKIYSDGTPISEEYDIFSVVIEEGVNKIGRAEIELLDGSAFEEDFPISNEDVFAPGKKLRIEAGYDTEEDIVFEGIIVRHSVQSNFYSPSKLRLECRHGAVKLTVKRNSKYYYDSTDSEIIQQVIQEAGLSPELEEATKPRHAEIVQFHTTDWDFIVSRAEANGLLVYSEGDTIRISKPDLGSSDTVLDLRFGGNIHDFSLEIDAQHQYAGTKSFAWDSAKQEMIETNGTDPSSALHEATSSSDLTEVIGIDAFELRHAGQLKTEELQAWADALFLKSQLAKVRGTVSFEGYRQMQDGSKVLKPGTKVQLEGVGDRFRGLAFVSEVQHVISTEGWETRIAVGLSPEWFYQAQSHLMDAPASGLLPAVRGLQVGLVTQLEGDPDGEFRALVRIPMIDAQEKGVWARVASLDAGENRGSVFRPEIGDEVVLGFLNDDPRNPVILGMLHSSSKPVPSDLEPKDDNHIKGYISRSEIKFVFDDEKSIVRLETPKGKKLTLDDDAGLIQIEDETGNKMIFDSNGITIETPKKLTLKATGDWIAEGMNVDQTAQAQFKAQGAAGAELSSSGQTVVKGSLVQIN